MIFIMSKLIFGRFHMFEPENEHKLMISSQMLKRLFNQQKCICSNFRQF